MPRYFLEISYKGTAYSGFQVQANAGSIQEEVEKAFAVSPLAFAISHKRDKAKAVRLQLGLAEGEKLSQSDLGTQPSPIKTNCESTNRLRLRSTPSVKP